VPTAPVRNNERQCSPALALLGPHVVAITRPPIRCGRSGRSGGVRAAMTNSLAKAPVSTVRFDAWGPAQELCRAVEHAARAFTLSRDLFTTKFRANSCRNRSFQTMIHEDAAGLGFQAGRYGGQNGAL
jgi:hypothetical protein